MRTFSRLITTFDEVPLITCVIKCYLKRRPPKSRPGRLARKVSLARQAARKDSAVHVSLSSDSLVKQPDCTTPGFAGHRFAAQVAQRAKARDIRAQKPPFDAAARTWPREHGRMLGHRVNSEGLRRRAIAPSGGAPKRSYIGFGVGFCQPFRGTERLKKQSFFAVSGARAGRRRCRFAIPTSLRGSAPEFCGVPRRPCDLPT